MKRRLNTSNVMISMIVNLKPLGRIIGGDIDEGSTNFLILTLILCKMMAKVPIY